MRNPFRPVGVLLLGAVVLSGGVADADAFALQLAEFAKYHRAITGTEAPDGAVSFAVDAKVSASGKDAYMIRSEGTGVKIVGSNERSTWYGLYDLLERRGGCHWFWDCDIIPRKTTIDLSGLDVTEEAQFEYRGLRYFAHRGLTRFQAEHWGLEDWKREIDWCLKRRLNVFMLRIGQDDLFQRAFPETCAYPDPSEDLSGHGKGFDNRTLFWSLQFRGKLRRDLQKYAFARGLLVPEDFGTMTHWYSRTPEDFLDGKKPAFLPQATAGYSEKNGLVWDIRDPKWVDAYWKLTTTACDAYGQGKDQELLHTIGLGERRCFKDRKDNHELKKFALRQFLDRADRDYPKAKRLLAGWDFYFTWHPEEVQDLVRHLDPERDIIWDYEGDSTRDYRAEMLDVGGNNFTKWGVCNRFPYTYSIFLAFESALDIRANYPLIEARQKIVQNDPKCAGYIFWPEASHTDTLLLEYFTANAWSKDPVGHLKVLDGFCAGRYGERAEAMKAVWKDVIPMSCLLDWGDNYGCHLMAETIDLTQHGSGKADAPLERWQATLKDVKRVFAALAEVDWQGEAIRRDTVDLARTALDRLLLLRIKELHAGHAAWAKGARGPEGLAELADEIVRLSGKMADLLELHTDYSLWESYERLDRIEKITNPNFDRVLMENATCGYCRSHQYEAARYLYLPRARAFADRIRDLVRAAGSGADLPSEQKALKLDWSTDLIALFLSLPLETYRPTRPRTPENFRALMLDLAADAERFGKIQLGLK